MSQKPADPAYPPPPPAYQPAPPGYGQPAYGQPGYGQGQTTVVLQQPALMTVQQFRESPVRTKCPSCSADIVTSTTYETGTMAWVICLVLLFFGLWLGCCLIPFCMDGCKDVIHTCPNCRTQVGKFNRM